MAAAGDCDRACLYDVLDRYLTALKARDPARAPLARDVVTSENNVVLEAGDGLWGTITALGDYQLRFADPQSGQIGFHGIVHETDTASPFAVRLKVRRGRIVEAETIVARPQDAGVPFVTAELAPLPVLNEIVPLADRNTRARMIELADGYFSTLQLNDGTLHTQFHAGCNRRENGYQTTNRGDDAFSPTMKLGCAEQFRLGLYRYDDRLRARRFEVIDEERGLIMAAGFIDHAGRLGKYRLTDGREVESTIFRRPHSFCLLETFKIRNDRIEQVEAVFITVPYHMPSPWYRGTGRR
ncbi:MAG: hypothetical protein IT480_11660 [Gammaproteobacteria bacterium]|nr:hypothetical protein [Gammaproteobacteria bacterium]